jgi:hypothetical protein
LRTKRETPNRRLEGKTNKETKLFSVSILIHHVVGCIKSDTRKENFGDKHLSLKFILKAELILAK